MSFALCGTQPPFLLPLIGFEWPFLARIWKQEQVFASGFAEILAAPCDVGQTTVLSLQTPGPAALQLFISLDLLLV